MAGVYLYEGGTVNNTGAIIGARYGLRIVGGPGTVDNQSGATIDAPAKYGVGVQVWDAGSVTNSQGASISGYEMGVELLDGGSVNNYGGATISGGQVGVLISGALGKVTNAGAIDNTSGDSVILDGGGYVLNETKGMLAGYRGVEIRGGTGTVTNQDGATIQATGYHGYGVKFVDYGKMKNLAGATIEATGEQGYGVRFFDGGTVTNGAGAIIKVGGIGVEATGAACTVTNAGTISATTASNTIYNVGVSLAAGGSIVNLAGGAISGYSQAIYLGRYGYGTVRNDKGALIEATSADSACIQISSGSVVNYGSIRGGYCCLDFGSGSATNHLGGSIYGGDIGIEIFGANGKVTNSGSIGCADTSKQAAGRTYAGIFLYAGGAVVNNAGAKISGYDGVVASGAATITNRGAVAGGSGRYSRGVSLVSGSLVNLGGASIAGGFYGVVFGDGGATLDNSGSIGVSVASPNRGLAVNLLDAGTVRNEAGGTIEGGYAGVCFGFFNQDAGGGGALVNAAGARISGDGGFIADGRAAAVTNSGAILGTTTAVVLENALRWDLGDGVALTGGGSVINLKGGSIEGARYGVYVSGGAGGITNAGTIAGATVAIKFDGGGVNKLTLETGSILSGSVVGSTAQGATNGLILTGAGSVGSAFVDFDTLWVRASGAWTLGGASTIGATTVSTGELVVAGALTTVMNENAAASVSINAKATLTLDGASKLSGATDGRGTLAFTAGDTTIADGATLAVRAWSILGAAATLAENLTFAGAFGAASGAVVDLSGGALTLTGTAAFLGAKTAGSQVLIDDATTKLSALTVGAGGFVNEGASTENGLLTLGAAAQLTNSATGTWDLTYGGSVAIGGSTSLAISNLGLFEKTVGADRSAVAPAFDNDGRTLVSAGKLDFEGAVTGTGNDTIAGAAILQFDSTVASTQTIDFTGADGVLTLGAPTGFSGVLDGFDTVGSGDAVQLLGAWSIAGFSTTSSQTTLTLSSGKLSEALVFEGTYSQSPFEAVVGAGRTTVTYT